MIQDFGRIKTVLVTGGAGYVGAVLIPKLLEKKYNVKVIDWYIYGDVLQKHKNLTEIKGDIRDKKLIKKLLIGTDAVIHLACISNDPSFELNRRLGRSVNFEATKFLYDESRRVKVKRFIYASTSSVYGIKSERNVTEDLGLKPLTDYSRYKALCEKYILSKRNEDICTLVLRPATVCGYSPRLRLDLTVNMLTMQALVNNKITVYGGDQLRPNIHIDDICDLYVNSLDYPKDMINGKIYNCGYQNLSVLNIALLIKKVLGSSNVEIIKIETKDKRSYHISSDKIFRELKFKPKKSVEQAITDLKDAHKKGLIPGSILDARYNNIEMMKQIAVK